MGRKIHRPRAEEGTFDIDLAPMLSMMVTLIPILLLSVIFVRVTVIDSSVPQVVADAIEKDRNNKDKSVDLTLVISDNHAVRVKISQNGRVSTHNVSPKGSEFDLEALGKKLAELKTRHPEVYTVNLEPGEDVSYDNLVKIMDAARTSRNQKFYITDPKTKERVEHNQMFPNVVFANVVEAQ